MSRRTKATICQLCLQPVDLVQPAIINLSRTGGVLDSLNQKQKKVTCKCCESCYDDLKLIRQRQLMWNISPVLLLLGSGLITALAVAAGVPTRSASLSLVIGLIGLFPMLFIGLFVSTRLARKLEKVVHPRVNSALKSVLSTKRWGVELMTILYNKSTWWSITDKKKPGIETVSLGEVVRTAEARKT